MQKYRDLHPQLTGTSFTKLRPMLGCALAVLALVTSCKEEKGSGLTKYTETRLTKTDAAVAKSKKASVQQDAPDEDLLKILAPSNAKGPRRRIIVSAFDQREPMCYTRVRLLDHFAKSRSGVELIFSDARGDATRHASQIQAEIASHPFAFIVLTPSLEHLSSPLSAAMDEKEKVIVIGTSADAAHATASIFVDDKKLGLAAGQLAVDSLKRKAEADGQQAIVGRVVELTGPEDSRISSERSAGFLEALTKQPGIRLVHQAPTGWDDKQAQTAISDAVRLQKTFDVVFVHSDLLAKAASTALKTLQGNSREQMLFIGVDGSVGKGGGVDMVLKGDIDATIYNPPMVDLGWKILVRLLDEPAYHPKQSYELAPFAITPDNAPQISSRGVPSPAM
jgi:ribose transport system substrate-binding protein